MKLPGARPASSPKTSSRNEQGFTFVEILVSMLLLSVLGLVIWSALARGQGLVQRTFQGTLEAVRVLQLDTGLRKAAGRVRVPYWERGPAADSSPVRGWWRSIPGQRRIRCEQ